MHKLLQGFRASLANEDGEAGINMVDLMMWLVIAALILAAAIQGIGFYQKAAYLYDMETEVNGVAANAHAAASTNGGYLSDDLLTTVVAESNAAHPNDQIVITFGQVQAYASGTAADNGYGMSLMSSVTAVTGTPGSYFLKAANPLVGDKYAVYFFDPTSTFQTGVSTVDKSKLDAAAAGTTPAPDPTPTTTASPTPTPTPTPTTVTAAVPSTGLTFRDLAASDDGTRLIGGGDAVTGGNGVRYSTDSGTTWLKDPAIQSTNAVWNTSISADGRVMLAGAAGTFLQVSNDYGATWVNGLSGAASSLNSQSVAPDGIHAAVAEDIGYAWTSANSGTLFTKRDTSGYRRWYNIFTSGDGTRIVAGAGATGSIYVLVTSNDSGANWTQSTTMTMQSTLPMVTASGNANTGTIAVARNGGSVFVSNDSGATWSEKTAIGTGAWKNITASADGTKIAVAKDGGSIFTSSDSGATWTEQTSAGSGTWRSIRITAAGGITAIRDLTVVKVPSF